MITAIVPARSGSKRLPGKNIKKLAGRPLIFHTIDSVLGQQEISEIIFTTDSQKYIELAKGEYGNKINYEYRPSQYAGDHIKVYDELRRLVNTNVIQTEWYLLCLPTSPLRTQSIVRSFLDQWKQNRTSIFSAVSYDFPTQFSFTLSKDKLGWIPERSDSPMLSGNTRSQDIVRTYRPNGAMYLQHVNNIKNNTLYIDANVYLMNREDSIDIDTELDFILCEHVLSKKNKNDK